MKYSLNNILEIKKSNDISVFSDLIDNDVKRYLFIIEYKFKDKKGHRSKYNNPKPISFNDIRISLNKLSNKTFDIQFKYIISTLHILPYNERPEIFNNIFIHLSQNTFMIEPYSKLAIILIEVFDEFKSLFYLKCNEFFTNINDINIIIPTSYEEICNQNKKNDNIKAQSQFLINTLIYLNEFELIKNFFNILQTFIKDNILNPENKDNVEFISNIYKNIITKSINELSYIMNIIKNHIKYILDLKSDKNINRKIIFHHMDINDLLNKNRKLE